MPEHDRALDAPAELGVAQQRAVAVHQLPAEARTADDLGHQRPSALEREGLGVGPGIRSGDHDGAGAAHEHVRVVVRLGGLVGLADAAAPW